MLYTEDVSPRRPQFSARVAAPAAWMALTLLIAACAGAPSTGPSQTTGEPGDIVVERPGTWEETAFTGQLETAQDLLAQRQLLPAASILRELDHSKLTPNERAWALGMDTELLYLQGRTAEALAALRQALPRLGGVHPAFRDNLDRWHLRLVLTEEGPLAAARLGDQLLLTTEDQYRAESLQNFTWYNLQRVRVEEIEAALGSTSATRWRGWLELALLAADALESPDIQSAQLDLWRQRYPDHSVSETLPGGLELLAGGDLSPPGRIALLLPLSDGPTDRGRAVLDGYMAARFEARRRGWPTQEVMIMDAAEQPDFASAYDTAVRAGAELVVGPLTPEQLIGWRPPAEDAVPLLTLSWHPDSEYLATPPAQLDLSPLDEARQLAQLGYDSGARRALVIRPEGDWGETMTAALLDAWSARDGEAPAVAVYSGQSDYSSSLKAALNLSESEARATRMRRLMGERTEFNPRRRQDIDIVFLLSNNPQDARSIKPLIAFHYAGDLPVYATSQVFSGRRDPQRDRDLNGVRLLEMPWLLDPEGTLQARVEDSGEGDLLADMHALGADAFLLHWRLAQLRAASDHRVRGYTGLLHMDSAGRVHRELVPARISNGVPRPR